LHITKTKTNTKTNTKNDKNKQSAKEEKMKEEDEKDMPANDKKNTEDEDGLLQQRNDGEGSMEYDLLLE
jgi:hypothetical protein